MDTRSKQRESDTLSPHAPVSCPPHGQQSAPAQAPTTPHPRVSTPTRGQESVSAQTPPTTPYPLVLSPTLGQQSAPSKAPPKISTPARGLKSAPQQAPLTTPHPRVSTPTQRQQSALPQVPPTTHHPSVSKPTLGQQLAPSQAPLTSPHPRVSMPIRGQQSAPTQAPPTISHTRFHIPTRKQQSARLGFPPSTPHPSASNPTRGQSSAPSHTLVSIPSPSLSTPIQGQGSASPKVPTSTLRSSASISTQRQKSAPSHAPVSTLNQSLTTSSQGQQSVLSQPPPNGPHPSTPTSIATQRQQFTAGAQPVASPAYHQVKTWKDCVQDWYPDLLQRAHFMPHVYMNRVLHDTVQVSGVDVAVPQSPVDTQHKGGAQALLHSDVRDDTAQQHVLHCLRKIADGALSGKPEVMFVLSQMNFGDYLNSPCYSSAASCLPRPVDLSGQGLSDGDFDVLVIHRQYGLMVGEIKAVGANAAQRGLSEQELQNELLSKLRKMLNLKKKKRVWRKKSGQLEKARKVLKHVTQDQPSAPRITATLMLPYITRQQLTQALATDDDVRKALCGDLNIPQTADPTDRCLCQDQMSGRNSSSGLAAWWRECMSGGGRDPALSNDVYTDLVARFAGPASVVRVHCPSQPRLQVMSDMRTEGDAVSETHDRLTHLALYPSQVDVLQQGGELVFLTGPPGTGKTLMLVLEGMEWLRQNQHVHIASLWRKSRAASFHIYHQLRETARQIFGEQASDALRKHVGEMYAERVHIHLLDLSQESCTAAGVEQLVAARTGGGELCVIADEANGVLLTRLIDEMRSCAHIRDLRLWAAGVTSRKIPLCLDMVTMTDPLRCPPSVVREVGEARDIQSGYVSSYTHPTAPAPCDGPPVIYIEHKKDQDGHSGRYPVDCRRCGLKLGGVFHRLCVGQASRNTSSGAVSRVIHNRDVIVATLTEAENKEAGVVQGLREAGYPVLIVESNDTGGIGELAAMIGPDVITMTHVDNIWGLERKVVVMFGINPALDDAEGRLYGMSRSTAQLIVVAET